MKKTNLSWVGALLVFALLLWCTAATPGTIADPASYAPAVYSSMLSLLPPVVAIVLALNTKEVYTSLLVGIATGALLFANGNLELAVTTLFFNEDGGMVAKLSDSSNVGILVFLVMLGILVALMNKAGGSAAFGRWASTHIHTRGRRSPAQSWPTSLIPPPPRCASLRRCPAGPPPLPPACPKAPASTALPCSCAPFPTTITPC